MVVGQPPHGRLLNVFRNHSSAHLHLACPTIYVIRIRTVRHCIRNTYYHSAMVQYLYCTIIPLVLHLSLPLCLTHTSLVGTVLLAILPVSIACTRLLHLEILFSYKHSPLSESISLFASYRHPRPTSKSIAATHSRPGTPGNAIHTQRENPASSQVERLPSPGGVGHRLRV